MAHELPCASADTSTRTHGGRLAHERLRGRLEGEHWHECVSDRSILSLLFFFSRALHVAHGRLHRSYFSGRPTGHPGGFKNSTHHSAALPPLCSFQKMCHAHPRARRAAARATPRQTCSQNHIQNLQNLHTHTRTTHETHHAHTSTFQTHTLAHTARSHTHATPVRTLTHMDMDMEPT